MLFILFSRDATSYKYLREAIDNNDTKNLKLIIPQLKDINEPLYELGYSPLVAVTAANKTELTNILLENGANPNTRVSSKFNKEIILIPFFFSLRKIHTTTLLYILLVNLEIIK